MAGGTLTVCKDKMFPMQLTLWAFLGSGHSIILQTSTLPEIELLDTRNHNTIAVSPLHSVLLVGVATLQIIHSLFFQGFTNRYIPSWNWHPLAVTLKRQTPGCGGGM